MESKSNTRLKRTTPAQYELLLNFVEENRILLHGKTKPQESDMIKKLWEKFAAYINPLGLGPVKLAHQWKNVSKILVIFNNKLRINNICGKLL